MIGSGEMTVAPRGKNEFVALVGVVFAMGAFGIDTMLPALPTITSVLTPDAPNNALLVVTSFVFGMGLGTLMAGALADSFGRRPIMLVGCMLYLLGATAGWVSPSLAVMIAGRVVQGIGASLTRIAVTASTRDLYAGTEMAKIMSFATMVFSIFPALAPFLGQLVVSVSGWRTIFLAYAIFAALLALWVAARQGETLHRANRSAFHLATIARLSLEVLAHGAVRRSILIQTLAMGVMFSTLSAIQPIFDRFFHLADQFPRYFAIVALTVLASSFLNARLVERVGVLRPVQVTCIVLAVSSLFLLLLGVTSNWQGPFLLPAFMVWLVCVFFVQGTVLGNLNALALEPLAHMAGKASSVIGSTTMIGASLLALPVSAAFDGTPTALLMAALAYSATAATLSLLPTSRSQGV